MNTNQQVWNIINSDLSIQKNLQRGIINSRALAKYIIETHAIQASLDAVISAIRRYQATKEFSDDQERVLRCFEGAQLFTKNNITVIVLNVDALGKLDYFFENVSKNYRLIRGKKYVKIITDVTDIDKLKKVFGDDIVEIKQNLSEIRIVIPQEKEDVRGLLARLSNEIALKDVSMKELIICFPDLLVYVNAEDLVATHDALMELTRKK